MRGGWGIILIGALCDVLPIMVGKWLELFGSPVTTTAYAILSVHPIGVHYRLHWRHGPYTRLSRLFPPCT